MTDLNERIHSLPEWNGGENFLIYNLYSGTWPEYLEELYFDIGKAMAGFRPYSEIIGNGRVLKFFSCKLVQHQKRSLHKNFGARRCLRRRVFY